MTIKLALFLVVTTSLAVAPQAIADDSLIMKTLLHNEDDLFTPPAENRASRPQR